ncbi:MAG: hypothetical protein LUF92_04250, partial [Clostridiales bacterium]|nr:hypothetical protein [Clostridiales bacterium]
EYLDMMGQNSAHHYFSIASMPSRYLAMIFSKYYNKHVNEQADYRFWEGDVNEVLTQIESHRSEIGFVYIQENQLTSFQYLLKRKRMEYVELKQGEAAIYVGKNSPYYGESEISLDMFPDMNFLKTNEGIYGVDTELEELIHNSKQKYYTNSTLSTNSDYVTRGMLELTDFAQISFIMKEWDEQNDQRDTLWAIPVPQIGNITFGYVKRLGEDIRDEVVEFLGYIQ